METSSGAERPKKPGRKPKGDRHLFQSRVPLDLADSVMEKATALGLTYSDYIALVLAEKHEVRLPAFYYPQSDGSVQEEFPMRTAS